MNQSLFQGSQENHAIQEYNIFYITPKTLQLKVVIVFR